MGSASQVAEGGRPMAREPVIRRWRPSDRLLYGALGFVVVLAIWEAASRLGLIKQVVLSSPTLILTAGLKDTASGAIWPHLQLSATEYVLGFAIALIAGVPLGLAIGLFRRLNYLIDPWLSAIYATPTVALVPLIILIAGIGLQAKIIVVVLEAIFVITVSAMAGVHAADASYHDIAQSFRASPWTRFRTVTLPASVPFILTGARLGTGRALVGVVVAEFLASNGGIGFYISLNGSLLQTARVYFGIILLGVLGVALGEAVRVFERRFERWRPAIN
jgi:ABC-type nitrate/sulfonate/bicarbonate transport system permease component